MLHAGLDLSRRKVDVCLLGNEGEHLDQLAVPPDPDSLRTLARRIDRIDSQVLATLSHRDLVPAIRLRAYGPPPDQERMGP